ncbi:hypothetical protein GCM10007086_24590 [Photobacterium aphoticum]|uniref:Uncharacterized protein n=2 Tax=Photobacterium aphoticum TaxID=754436 RepID=A0A0J1GNP6_9GAMM|nr:hypothetical protein [Photobacterium aphoticum]KLV01211.1 hypothetical protein ABT58_08785 [Photobacterium aphoticum]PSU57007.1 hypothetical protein C9I90_10910 [Photobacterium aphoticum]GHA49770.1 hypothetical protein GCM10007086_24590 [Photobacterium aphoticum]
MSKYNDQYYLAFNQCNEDGNILFLQMTDESFNRDPCWVKLNDGEQPLFLEDSCQEIDIQPTKAHMNLQSLVVSNDIYLDLVDFDIKNFQLYPTVIIDRNEKYHEGYWFFNTYADLPALDLDKSDIHDLDLTSELHYLQRISLSDEILDAIPEEERLIFPIAGSDMGHIAFHQKIVDVFNKHKVKTIKFIKISEWEEGWEFDALTFK